ncbi:MAG: hypothetical protein COB59_10075 [Rhodospirillaceae bacterium]|nr:MAG: hypothetical protein COB59_10075 [Rhodospirillaceae bacterium]
MLNIFRCGVIGIGLVLTLAGCVTPGSISSDVNLNEGQLIQRLEAENCSVSSRSGGARKTTTNDVAVMGIKDGQYVDERIANVGVHGLNTSLYYIKSSAQVACELGGYFTSQILVDSGGNPQKRVQHRTMKSPLSFDVVRKLRAKWKDISAEGMGTIGVAKSGTSGTILIQFPMPIGNCFGSFFNPPNPSYGVRWNISCQNGHSDTGNLHTPNKKGAHAEGKRISFTVGEFS